MLVGSSERRGVSCALAREGGVKQADRRRVQGYAAIGMRVSGRMTYIGRTKVSSPMISTTSVIGATSSMAATRGR